MTPSLRRRDGPARKPGIGLANTRARLAKIYGLDYRLEMNRRPEGRHGGQSRFAVASRVRLRKLLHR